MQNVKEFRGARSDWVTSYANQAVRPNIEEGFYKPNFYTGRCSCLRRTNFKTTFLPHHRKSVRFFKFFNLKRKILGSDANRSSTDSQENLSSADKLKLGHEHEKHQTGNRKRRIISDFNNETSQEDILKLKNENEKSIKSKHREKKVRNGSLMKKLKPGQKAINKLKAAKMKKREMGSCTCKEGKYLAMVIKNIGPNYKKALNGLKVYDEYSESTVENIEPEESLSYQLRDSLEVHKKKMCPRNKSDLNKTILKKGCDQCSKLPHKNTNGTLLPPLTDSLIINKKLIGKKNCYTSEDLNKAKIKKACEECSKYLESKGTAFCQLKDSLVIHKKQKSGKKVCPANESDLNKAFEECFKLTEKDKDSEEKVLCEFTNSLEIHKKRTNKKKICREKNEDVQPDFKSKNKMRLGEEKSNVKNKKKMKEIDEKDSLIVLYKNPCKSKSTLALTKEQLIKLGKCCEETIIFKI